MLAILDVVVLTALVGEFAVRADEPGEVRSSGGAASHRWDLSGIYANWDDWQTDVDALHGVIERFAGLEGGIAGGSGRLLEALELWEEVYDRAFSVEGYVRLRLDADRRDSEAIAPQAVLDGVDTAWRRASDWFEGQVRAIDQQLLDGWLDESAKLAVYRARLERLRGGSDALDQGDRGDFDEVLARTLLRLHAILTAAEAPSPEVTLSSGESVRLTRAGTRSRFATLASAEDRKAVARAWYEAIGDRSATFAALLEGVVKRQLLRAGVTEPGDVIAMAGGRWRLPPETIDGLISSARAGNGSLRRYHRIRKKALGLASYGAHDRFVPLKLDGGKYDYDVVTRQIIESTAVLGQEYQRMIARPFAEGWVDVYEREGKRATPAAYRVYGDHPWILLNWGGSFRDALSAAHETGHEMHSLVATRSQPFVYTRFGPLVAETAALTNEGLFLDSLTSRQRAKDARIAELDLAVQELTRTYYRTVLAAEFELEVYRAAARGEALTADLIDGLYTSTLEAYYGDAVELESWDAHGWIETRHYFVAPFYMLQYGVSFVAAAGFLDQLSTAEEVGRRNYLAFLEAGSSRNPIELLRLSGVDPADPASFEFAARRLEALVSELDRLLAEL